ncbi:MAG: hypothetical protein NT116_00945 [Candidatus Parcubacteria bacterium]|nr:hypothetical protein [Candidatus Parcubacteria bacterium]
MMIKFSDKFESIFYAILLNNLTGNFLVSKNNSMGLFADDEFIDIDKLNCQQILEEHNHRFGKIKWLDFNNFTFLDFKKQVELELQRNNANKYKKVIFLIKQALKFGLFWDDNLKHEKVNSRPQKPIELIRAFDRTLI